MSYPETINNLVECYKKFPGVGEKSAERMALYTLEMDQEIIDLFGLSNAEMILFIEDDMKSLFGDIVEYN